MTLTVKQTKYLDFLIADYNAIKSEIGRRSNLQRIVLASYIAVLAYIGKAIISSGSLSSAAVTGMWIYGALSFQFYKRESHEIARLGRTIIKQRIASSAAKILEVDIMDVFHSETNASVPEIDELTSLYNRQFSWIIYFFIPLVVTILHWGKGILPVCAISFFAVFIEFGFAIWVLILLFKYRWKKSK